VFEDLLATLTIVP